MIQPVHALLPIIALILVTACGGSDSNNSQSTGNQPPATSEDPTKPPPTTQPPNTAPPEYPTAWLQPPGSAPPGSGSGGFTQGTGFNAHVRTIVTAQDGTNDLYVGGDFTTYNGQPANHLIRLRPNGTVAQTFGQGFDEVVVALALATDGSHALYAGGPFTQFNGQPVPQLVRLTLTAFAMRPFSPATLALTSWHLRSPKTAPGTSMRPAMSMRGFRVPPSRLRLVGSSD